MKSRTVILLWIAAFALGITSYFVKFSNNEENITRTTLSPGDQIIPDLPIRDVIKVTLSSGDQKTTLVRLDEQRWGVVERDNYAVNYELLRNLLGTLSELEVAQGYPAGEEQFERFGLSNEDKTNTRQMGDSGQALQVTIAGKDQTIIPTIFLGKYSGSGSNAGRFIRINNDESGVYAVGETFPGITASPRDWLNKAFLQIDQIKSIAVSAPADPSFKPWQLIRKDKADGSPDPNGQFNLANMSEKEVMELTSTNQLRNLLRYSSFQDILTTQEASDTANPDQTLKRHATIITYDGFKYILEFRPQKLKPVDPDADDRLPPVPPGYLLTIQVNADIPEKRVPDQDESKEKPETIQARDREFTKQREALMEKLATTRSLVGPIYQVGQSTISPLLKRRSDFVKKLGKPSPATPPLGIPGNSPGIPLYPQR